MVTIDAVEKAKIPVHYSEGLTWTKDAAGGVKVTFPGGAVDTRDLLLGCHGIHSSARKLHVDSEHTPKYTGMAGLGALMSAFNLSEAAISQIRGINSTLRE